MPEAQTPTDAPVNETAAADESFAALENSLNSAGPAAALDRLIEQLDSAGDYRALLDALLLKARHELGLPLVMSGPLSAVARAGPDAVRGKIRRRHPPGRRATSRARRYPDRLGVLPRDRRKRAGRRVRLATISPSRDDERLGAVIEVAFNHGVSPERGFELILENYGTCPAITAFEQIAAHDEDAIRAACAGRLIRRLHRELTANLRAEITSRGQILPAGGDVRSPPWSEDVRGFSRMSLITSTSRTWRRWCGCRPWCAIRKSSGWPST